MSCSHPAAIKMSSSPGTTGRRPPPGGLLGDRLDIRPASAERREAAFRIATGPLSKRHAHHDSPGQRVTWATSPGGRSLDEQVAGIRPGAERRIRRYPDPVTTEAADEAPMTASPYSTGGGGTVLEHRYGAVLLAHLLAGDPVPTLGDDATPVSVRFQASPFSPVDDLLVVGRTPDDGRRQISIGVRRSPSLVASEEASTRLLASYLRTIADHWEDVRAGRWRLGLAVASPNAAVQQVRELAVIARSTPNNRAFRAEVERP